MTTMTIPCGYVHDDGGRAAAGYRGKAGDCVVRAIAIATQIPYQVVYDSLNGLALDERPRSGRKRSNSRTGVKMQTINRYMQFMGWSWVPTMAIGSGCRVHLAASELPSGRIVARISRHLVAVIDGVIHDTYDPSRDGVRCVYGYWQRGAH